MRVIDVDKTEAGPSNRIVSGGVLLGIRWTSPTKGYAFFNVDGFIALMSK
jgi:hypothetical protein